VISSSNYMRGHWQDISYIRIYVLTDMGGRQAHERARHVVSREHRQFSGRLERSIVHERLGLEHGGAECAAGGCEEGDERYENPCLGSYVSEIVF
jgi:hypothetical protein